ncbi:MAG: LytTR family transcriptional regulator DNA-binding domain-containing protein [Saprospiraceae bacterium]|nr:LytTR family transcriptional regulator DNA-binding domain-containing protein [Saprospiraceae bacterium]
MQLKKLEDILPKSNFQRVQKTYIVNLDKVTTIR